MRQGNGTELLGMNDPRSATIGVIYVSPNDDRKSVLAAILTQEKLGRKDIVIDLPQANNAFQNAQDFKDLEKDVARKLQAKIIFITTDDAADYARQRQFAVFPTLDSYTQSLDANTVNDKKETPERRLPFFGRKSKPLNQGAAVAGGAVAGAAAASALSNAGQGNARTVGQPTNAGAAQTNIDEPDGQGATQMSPRRGSASSAPPAPAASTSTIDDDDAIDGAPSVPVRHGPGAAGMAGAAAAGAAGGFLVGETLRPGQAALDSAGPTPLKSAPPNTPAVAAVSPSSQASAPPATPTTNPSEPATGGEAGGDPGIIDLRPVPRGGNRSTVDLQGSAAAAGAAQATRSIEPPPSRGATRRRNAGGAAVAGLAAGGLLGAAAASSAPAGAPTAASGGAGATAARPNSGGQPPQRGAPPGRGRRGNTPPRRRRALLLLLLLLLLTALISGFVYSSINPGGFQSIIVRPFSNLVPAVLQANPTTITIVPDSKEVQDSYVMQAVTTQANADQLQVSMRNLNIAPNAQNKTVAGTGNGTIAAVVARGRLTFINGSFAPYTVASGTVISAPTGVSVVTEQPAAIPAGVPGGANGSISVPAHAVTAGTVGNLDQGSINKICCSTGASIFVRNDAAFTGGVDPKTYTFVRQGDVNATATPLEATLTQEASMQFKQQLKPNEKLVSDPTCNSNVQVPPGTVGDQGHNIAATTITVTAKCTGVAYDQGGAQAVAKDRLQKKANIDPGQGYSLVGNIVTSVSVSKVNPDSISLLVNARGIWAYQFDTAKEQALAKQLAGKKLTDAQSFLNAQHGINNAKIATKGDTLPTDPTQITFTIQKVPGESANSTGDNGSSNPSSTPASVSGNGLVPSGKDISA